MPKIARIAYIAAFLIAGGTVVSALAGQIFLLPFALIPLIAGIGIMRRRVWSAWGFAVYTLAQLFPVSRVLFRSTGDRTAPPGAIGAVALAAILIPLFFFAGRSLARAAAKRGSAWPWIAASALTGLPVFFVQAFVVPTATMEDTLLVGDRVLVQHFPRTKPARGDMIVFIYPIDRRQTFVKRVIGVPGDRIRISHKIVYRNGAALGEPYAVHKTDYEDEYRDNFPVNGEVVVPEGEYFVLGDNRDFSLDSRYWGFIGAGDLIGKPLLIYDSEDQATRTVRWGRLFTFL